MRLLIVLLLALVSISSTETIKTKQYVTDIYPTTIPKFAVRKDASTGEPVHSGLLHTLPNRSTLAEFRRHMQCSVKDSNLNYNNGMISKLRLSPPNVASYTAFCSLVERRQFDDWSVINSAIEGFRNGSYSSKKNFNKLNPYSRAELLRVKGGDLYIDWPWGIERLNAECNDNMISLLIKITLDRITDIKDSVFFTGGADPVLPEHITVPYLAFCTAEHKADLVVPWSDMWKIVHKEYLSFREQQVPFTEEGYVKMSPGYRPWKDRIDKAALFGTMMRHRQIMFDVARLHPEYIEAGALDHNRCIVPWHPASTEPYCNSWAEPEPGHRRPNASDVKASAHFPAGYVLPLYSISSARFLSYKPAAFKYVVVPLGEQRSISTSARIAHLLTFSGAVVLLQRSVWRYHFSAQFLPWVHYVPFSFTGADLEEKIQWLRDHDELARQIAENGRNFGRSYLRLEDFFCYMAGTLETLAVVSREVAEAEPFNAFKVPKQCNPSQHILYQYPV